MDSGILQTMSFTRMISKALSEPMRIADHELQITSSLGVAVYPVSGTDDIRELMKKADSAMYAAKDGGRNAYRFFKD
jgi:diguanylate cyclase (GGDEF)-like protein